MKRAVHVAVHVAALVACACGLGGCGGLAGSGTWQVVGVYTDAFLPGELPADAAGKANFQIRGKTVRGTTPCVAVEGTIEKGSENDPDDDRVTLTAITIEEPQDPGACVGGSRHVHDQLTQLLTPGAQFRVLRPSDGERLLVSTADEQRADPPSIRAMLL